MNEAVNTANNVPAIILLSLWWAFLSTLAVLFNPGESEKPNGPATTPRAADTSAVADEPRFSELVRLDPKFSIQVFLDGARRAYEQVVQAYAAADLARLSQLLSPEVMRVFADDCTARRTRDETLDLTFIGMVSVEIEDIRTTSEAMEITVLFRAEVVSALRAQSGEVLAGDPTAVVRTADLWTFSRPLPVGDEAWIVTATDEERTRA